MTTIDITFSPPHHYHHHHHHLFPKRLIKKVIQVEQVEIFCENLWKLVICNLTWGEELGMALLQKQVGIEAALSSHQSSF